MSYNVRCRLGEKETDMSKEDLKAVVNPLISASRSEITDNVVGKSVKEAAEYLKSKNMRIRTLIRDGKKLMGTMDYRIDRVNVSVENDVVVSVLKIG